MRLVTSCSLASLLVVNLAAAATGSWQLDFEEEKLDPYSPALFVIPGQVATTLLHVEQNDYCTQQTPDAQNPACPASASLRFAALPSGVSACFVTTSGCVAQTALGVGGSVYVRVTTSPLAAFQTFDLRVNAIGSTGTTRSTTLPVHLVPPLFDPPSPLKIYRGGPASTVTLPLTRPSGMIDSISLGLLFEAGSSSSKIFSSFAPATLSSTGSSTTLSIVAGSSAMLGSRDVAIAASPLRQLHSLLAPFEIVIAEAFTIAVPAFTVPRGGTVGQPITVTRDPDFTGTVAFAITGMTCWSGTQAAISNGTLYVEASDTAEPRQCLVGVRGSWSSIVHETTVTVTIE